MEQDLRTDFSFPLEVHQALMHIIQQSLDIHWLTEMFLWLQGDVQEFIPHETLIAVWGDIPSGQFHCKVISADQSIHGSNSSRSPSPEMEALVHRCYDRWTENRCHPVTIEAKPGFGTKPGSSNCAVMRSLSRMTSVVIHGIEDERGAGDCLYMAFHSATCPDRSAVCRMTELIVPFIDVTLRRVRRSDTAPENGGPPGNNRGKKDDAIFGLSPRELEIMKWVRYGKTNEEIGMILSISIFTVKNHLQRVFEKLNVVNRTQAVAKLITPHGGLRAGAN